MADFHRWYFGQINRRRAIELLSAENNVVGSFLVRDSDQVRRLVTKLSPLLA
jgi:SH2 domain